MVEAGMAELHVQWLCKRPSSSVLPGQPSRPRTGRCIDAGASDANPNARWNSGSPATESRVQGTLCDSEILRCLPMFCLFVAARRVARAGHDERSQAVVVTQHGGTQL